MGGYLIYHPSRQRTVLNEITVYHDGISGNQDPYVWNDAFLHTFCHINALRSEVRQINFWVSGRPSFRNFTQLYCDLVFVIAEKRYWDTANGIERDDPIIDSDAAFNDHYRWWSQHPFARRRRYTLKAAPDRSFQPQTPDGCLLDLVPALQDAGISLPTLTQGLRAGFQSKPMRLDRSVATQLYDWLCHEAAVRLKGSQLAMIRAAHPELASPEPDATMDDQGRPRNGVAACGCARPGQQLRQASVPKPRC